MLYDSRDMPDQAEKFEQFKQLYAHRTADGKAHIGPYFNRVLSLQVKLDLPRVTLRRWARLLHVQYLEGGLQEYPTDVAAWDTDVEGY